MAEQSIDVLIEGGKATAAPPLGPALGPLGINIGQVVADINKKTQDFKGMQVPVKITVDDDKNVSISVGTPPASQLIKVEAGIKLGSGKPKDEHVADLKIQQIMKIASMKEDALLGKNAKMRVKEIIGTCQSMGVMVEGKHAPETLKDLDAGQYDELIKSGRTELSEEEKKALEEEKKVMQAELAEKHAEQEGAAQAIMSSMAGKDRAVIIAKMHEEEIPESLIHKLLPAEEASKDDEAPAEKKEKEE